MSLLDDARGRWVDILQTLGVPGDCLRNVHGPCPACGGKDRFRFDDNDGCGTYFCSHCGAGTGVNLVAEVNGWDMKHAYREVRRVLGKAKVQPAHVKKSSDRWRMVLMESTSMNETVRNYLLARGLKKAPLAVGAHQSLAYYHDGKQIGCYPAMVAKVQSPGGNATTVHVTYLDGTKKADVPSPKKLLSSPGNGAAIRLAAYIDTLGIAEGIETALAAWQLHGVPTWAAISAHGLETWWPPEDVTRVVVFADCDKSMTGQRAAYILAHRLAQKGRHVEVEMPSTLGQDWADVVDRDRR